MDQATRARLRSTQLDDRTLWFDGDSSYDPKRVLEFLNQYQVKYVDYIDEQIQAYNKHVSRSQELTVKTASRPISTDWNIPDEYKHLNVIEYLFDKHIVLTKGLTEQEAADRDYRLLTELALFKKHDLFSVLRAIIWIINTLTANDVVWGVGRGSSVSSYVLYVIGVHDVDAFAYDLDIADFLHD